MTISSHLTSSAHRPLLFGSDPWARNGRTGRGLFLSGEPSHPRGSSILHLSNERKPRHFRCLRHSEGLTGRDMDVDQVSTYGGSTYNSSTEKKKDKNITIFRRPLTSTFLGLGVSFTILRSYRLDPQFKESEGICQKRRHPARSSKVVSHSGTSKPTELDLTQLCVEQNLIHTIALNCTKPLIDFLQDSELARNAGGLHP